MSRPTARWPRTGRCSRSKSRSACCRTSPSQDIRRRNSRLLLVKRLGDKQRLICREAHDDQIGNRLTVFADDHFDDRPHRLLRIRSDNDAASAAHNANQPDREAKAKSRVDALAKKLVKLSVSPEDAPDKAEYVELDFVKGDCVAVNGKKMSPGQVLKTLNKLGGKHGIGRVDLVENRFVGMKSRGVYETPGGTILMQAHRQVESLTLDREVLHTRDSLIPKYAELIYNGFWFAPERECLQAYVDESQRFVTGTVRLKLYKGNIITCGRKSKYSLYDMNVASMEGVKSWYNQSDATGFIRLNGLRLRARHFAQGGPKL